MPTQEEMTKAVYEALFPKPSLSNKEKEIGDLFEAHLNRKKLRRILKNRQ